jgi:hypothetical protein
MEESPSWEDNSHSANQQIPRLLRKLKVHYCVHKSSQHFHILSQTYPVHILPPHFPKIHYNIIFTSTPRYSVWSSPFIPTKILCPFRISHACYIPCPYQTSNEERHWLLKRSRNTKWTHFPTFLLYTKSEYYKTVCCDRCLTIVVWLPETYVHGIHRAKVSTLSMLSFYSCGDVPPLPQ